MTIFLSAGRFCIGVAFATAVAVMPAESRQATAAPQSPGAATDSPLDKVPERLPSLYLPLPSCAVPAVAAFIARMIEMPAGIEYAPEPCYEDGSGFPAPPPQTPTITLTGLTARAALDRLVILDPRYRWLVSDGVLVFRPLAAWDDPFHFLHTTFPSLQLEAVNFATAFQAISNVLLGFPADRTNGPYGQHTAQGRQLISVTLATSGYEALNRVVRTHGALRWRVVNCGATGFPPMFMDTYDGAGLGRHAVPAESRRMKLVACLPPPPPRNPPVAPGPRR
jgi:hypothetical protein